jgi:antitoxin component YwqK of YwqJK toxin-antitoxin module
MKNKKNYFKSGLLMYKSINDTATGFFDKNGDTRYKYFLLKRNEGKEIDFFENGFIAFVCSTKNRQKYGFALEFSRKGFLHNILPQTREEACLISFRESGIILETRQLKDFREDGQTIVFNKEGIVEKKIFYTDGVEQEKIDNATELDSYNDLCYSTVDTVALAKLEIKR